MNFLRRLVCIFFCVSIFPTFPVYATDITQCLSLISDSPALASADTTIFDLCRYDDQISKTVNPKQAMAIGTYLANNYPAKKGLPEAALWVKPLAESGDPDAIYLYARSVPISDPRAPALFALAAKQGSLPAEFMLARLYDEGRYVERDTARADTLFRDLAAKKYDPAVMEIKRRDGTMYDSLITAGDGARSAEVFAAIVLGLVALSAVAGSSSSNNGDQPRSIDHNYECDGAMASYAWSGLDEGAMMAFC